jgi:FkbM family methyltransferase
LFYSQFGEDRILAGLFPGQMKGTCVEVGANDGVSGSTTLYFERIGWRCVLVEPNPELAAKLRRERTAQTFECAASSTDGTATLHIAEGAELAHGVSTIEPEDKAREKLKDYGFSARPVEVRTRPLDGILEEAAVEPGFEFLSIDVEGHELEVLKGFSLDRWKPRFIIVEDNSFFSDAAVRRHVAGAGYVAFLRTGVNDWYALSNDPAATASRRRRYLWTMARSRVRSALRRIPGLRSLYRRLWRSGR